METSFNLIDQPWIPCIDLKGNRRLLSLNETLVNAAQLREIDAEYPPVTASLLILLLAVVNRVFAPPDDEAWEELWEAQGFDRQKLAAYFGQWYPRFDLFDETHPFYQDPKIGKRPKDVKNMGNNPLVVKSFNSMLLHRASGGEATLFDHSMDEVPETYSPAEAARYLLMIQNFSLRGFSETSIPKMKHNSDSLHATGIVFFVIGPDLFTTILYNLTPITNWSTQFRKVGIPSWERDDNFFEELDTTDEYAHFLSWQSRRILLQPETKNEKLIIKNIYYVTGNKGNKELKNPFYHYYFDENNNKWKHLRFFEEKALWRDSSSILQPNLQKSISPASLRWLAHIKANSFPVSSANLLAVGSIVHPTDKKIFSYRQDSFYFPVKILIDPALAGSLEIALDLAGNAYQILRNSLKTMAQILTTPKSSPNEKASKNAISLYEHWQAEGCYWSTLEIPFYHYLSALDQSPEKALKSWKEVIHRSVLLTFQHVLRLSGNNPRALKAGASVEGRLFYQLKKLLDPEQQETV